LQTTLSGESRFKNNEIHNDDAIIASVSIQPNPNQKAPLVAVVGLKAQKASKVHIDLVSDKHQKNIVFDRLGNFDIADHEYLLPVIGLYPSVEYSVLVTVYDQIGQAHSWSGEKLTYRTPDLPTNQYEWPKITVSDVNIDLMEPGYFVLSVRRSIQERPQLRSKVQNDFMKKWGLIVILDQFGEVVWYYKSDSRVAGIEPLENGNILYQLADSRTVEIDMMGNVVRQYYAENRPEGPLAAEDAVIIKGIQTLHHQPHLTEDGNFLSFSANYRLLENWYTNEYDPVPRKTQRVMGDTIIKFSPQGNILWEWNAFDYLDPYQIGYEAFDPYWTTRGFPDTWDWTHGNGVSHDPRDDSIVASFKLLDAIIKIDKKTKNIKWIFGDHAGWAEEYQDKLLTPLGENFKWPYHQHNPRWTKAGTLLVFNNNRGQTKPFDGQEQVPYHKTRSYTAEYEIDEQAGTVRQVWTSENTLSEDSCVSFAMSEAHRLPQTDNILEINAQCGTPMMEGVTWDPWDLSKVHMSEMPRGGRVREYTRTENPKIVFNARVHDPAEVLIWEVYGGFKIPDFEIRGLSPALMNKGPEHE